MLEPSFNAAYKQYEELSAENPNFKRIYPGRKEFRGDQFLWFRVAQNTFDNFNFSMSAEGRNRKRPSRSRVAGHPAGLFLLGPRHSVALMNS